MQASDRQNTVLAPFTRRIPWTQIGVMLFLPLILTSFLAGCSFQAGTSLPTVLPTGYIPTAIALTVQAQGIEVLPVDQPGSEASVTPSPTSTIAATPTPTPEPATPSPTPILAATWTAVAGLNVPPVIPYAPIQILSPGPASLVTSPFLLRGSVRAGAGGVVRIELLGEDGRLLMREVRDYRASVGRQVSLATEVEFGISAVAEAGRIQVSTEDEFGRLVAVGSVDIILLSIGEAEINPVGDLYENIVIESPPPNAVIQGGMVRVTGLARPRSELPLMVEMRTADGKIVGSRQVAVIPSAESSYGTFAIEVSYSVDAPTRVRLAVWEPGERIPGIVQLSSLEVMLSP